MLITKHGRPTAVITSADEWASIEDTDFWRAVPEIGKDLDDARAAPGVPLEEYLAQRRSQPG